MKSRFDYLQDNSFVMQIAGIRVGGGKLCAGVTDRGVFVNCLDRMTNELLQKYSSVQNSYGRGKKI
jgi:hypothetical protein